MRINKYLSNLGYCSRKEVNRWIAEGRVVVNGALCIEGQWVEPEDDIRLDGVAVTQQPPIYLMLNKPVGIVCTAESAEANNIVQFIGHDQYLFPVGRLDKDSEGLMLLTNDGDLANRILNAEFGHEKEYRVTVDRPYDKAFVEKMEAGILLKGVMTRQCKIVSQTETTFDMILSQGLNRQIRKMCGLCGYKVMKLQRTRLLTLELDSLPLGQWRHLTEEELERLKRRI